MQRNDYIHFMADKLLRIYRTLDSNTKNLVTDYYYQCIACLKTEDFKGALINYKNMCRITTKSDEALDKLFLTLTQGEDFIESNSFILISKDSPFCASLDEKSKKLGFTIKTHQISEGAWTKDYVISTGENVFFPAKKKKDDYLKEATNDPLLKNNPSLYYEKLKMQEHHAAKTSIHDSTRWRKETKNIIPNATHVPNVALEGGNFFCAINHRGERYCFVGANVLSETQFYHSIDCQQAIGLLAKDLGFPADKIIIIPQWTYHLDLQMAYLGKGQFIIHSFDQKNFDFNLDSTELEKVKKTFKFLHDQFEAEIIDNVCDILKRYHFSVEKVFSCLFYLNDTNNPEELKYVPYCKNAESGEGSLAFLINGIAGEEKNGAKYFLTSRCENEAFKKQFETQLARLGTRVEYIDMPQFYDSYGSFDGMLAGIMGINSVGEYIAYMNGGLRCQTSIINKNASPEASHDQSMTSATKRYGLIQPEKKEIQEQSKTTQTSPPSKKI